MLDPIVSLFVTIINEIVILIGNYPHLSFALIVIILLPLGLSVMLGNNNK